METHLKKQLIITFIVFLILVLLSFLIYSFWFKVKPSCFDGIQNQDEEGIDCGGICSSIKICEPLKSIEVNFVDYVKVKDGIYDVVARIKNPNQNHGLEELGYEFNLYGQNQEVLASRFGKTFIMPREEKYIIEANITTEDTVSGTDFNFTDFNLNNPDQNNWQKLHDYNTGFGVDIVDTKFGKNPTDGTSYFRASGLIQNNTLFDLDKVVVSIVLFDRNHTIIGLNKTEANTIKSGEKRFFVADWFDPIDGDMVYWEMRAETNFLSDENFIKQYGETQKF